MISPNHLDKQKLAALNNSTLESSVSGGSSNKRRRKNSQGADNNKESTTFKAPVPFQYYTTLQHNTVSNSPVKRAHSKEKAVVMGMSPDIRA